VVGDAPAVLDVERGLVNGNLRTRLEGTQTNDGVLIGVASGRITAITPVGAARIGFASHRLEVVDIHTAAQQVITQRPLRVNAELLAIILGVRATQEVGQAAADDLLGGTDVARSEEHTSELQSRE